MSWWAWIAGGMILLGAELLFVDAQFYLVFLGVSAILVGAAQGAVPGLPDWVPWGGFAVLSLSSVFAFRRRIYERMRGRPSAFSNSPLGAVLELAEDLAPSATCRIEHAGTSWNVRNEGGEPITAGVRVRVTAVDGLTLGVRPVPPSEPA